MGAAIGMGRRRSRQDTAAGDVVPEGVENGVKIRLEVLGLQVLSAVCPGRFIGHAGLHSLDIVPDTAGDG